MTARLVESLAFWNEVTKAPAPVHITTTDGCEVNGTLCAVDGKQQIAQVSVGFFIATASMIDAHS